MTSFSLPPLSPLPPELSPTAAVRRSCATLMSDPPASSDIDGRSKGGGTTNTSSSSSSSTTSSEEAGNSRTVGIFPDALNTLATSIASHGGRSSDNRDRKRQFVEWDEGGWHYTASAYVGRGVDEEDCDVSTEIMRMERVALYVLALDAINFCFWPTSDGSELLRKSGRSNFLEYEHLATALRKVAEADDNAFADDNVRLEDGDNDGRTSAVGEETVTAAAAVEGGMGFVGEDSVTSHASYALSPPNLAELTPLAFLNLLSPHLPSPTSGGMYLIPNLNERVRLLNEVGWGLIEHHSGSALCMAAKASRSADRMVDVLTSTFPGFRDEAVDDRGRHVRFYKRAQIAAADLWAALGPGPSPGPGAGAVPAPTDRPLRARHPLGEVCCFRDIAALTTFADYRVPQLLRHLGVLRYAHSLAEKVDRGEEMCAGCMDELYLRAGTVVAVDRLVEMVRAKLKEEYGSTDGREGGGVKEEEMCAVKMDWHLWQVGEKLDREGKLGRHHLVRTIFY